MAKPRPPVIISNGSMRSRFESRIRKLNTLGGPQDETDVIYGLGPDNGFLTLVTLDNKDRFVYWRAEKGDPIFSCLSDQQLSANGFSKRSVIAEEALLTHTEEWPGKPKQSVK